MQDVYEYIFKRKSVRKYKSTHLSAEELTKIQDRINTLVPLHPEIKCSVKIRPTVNSFLKRGASHFIVFISEEKEGYLENIGFLGQQLELYFSSQGLGACWLGMSKTAQDETLPFIISIAVGYPDGTVHRNMAEFKRKTIAEISEGSDQRLEAARLAPSSINSQGWYFIANNGIIHCYRAKLGVIKNYLLGKFIAIDFGIALCHLCVAGKHFGPAKEFHFSQEKDSPKKDGFIYAGSIR